MKLPAYPRTKPSGVEWLGDVPEHWEVVAYKRNCNRVEVGIAEAATHAYCDEGVPIIRSTNVKPNRLDVSDVLRIEPWFAAKNRSKTLRAGDLVTVRTGYPGTTAVVPVEFDGCQCFTLVMSSPKSDAHGPFLSWVLNSHAGVSYFEMEGWGTAQTNISVPIVQFIPVPRPPPVEQRAIAAFLDRETGRVDRLVAKKRELIERLKEKRTALISRTVTCGLPAEVAAKAGLPSNPPLKPSGVEWLGEIPQHWEVKKIKFVAKMESGHTPSKSEPSNWVDDECVIPWVSLNDTKHLKEHDYIGETAVKISEEGMKNSSAHLLPSGVVVFTRDATIGLTAITTCPAAVSQHIIAWVPGPKITPKYLLLAFKVMQQYLESFTFGSTLKTIGMTDVRKLVTPVPPLPEQAAIAAYLDEETAKLDALVGKVEEAVERLQEYRTALITAAVTGKIDVRNIHQTA